MAGSWERTNNDAGEYKQYIKETTGPLLYQLDPNRFYNCQECRPDQPGKLGSGISTNKKWPLVDVESDLKNITRPLSNDPKVQFGGGGLIPNNGNNAKQPTVSKSDSQRNYPSCNILTDETRLTNPACNLRGTGVSQHVFFQLQSNPQELSKVEYPGAIRENTSNLAKDTYVDYARPFRAGDSLPSGSPIQIPIGCNNVPLVFTDPLNSLYGKEMNDIHVQPALNANYTHLMEYYNKMV